MSGSWWNAEKGHVHESVVSTIMDLINKGDGGSGGDHQRREDLASWRAMYMDIPGPNEGFERAGFHRNGKSENNQLTGAIEATVAQLTSSRPKPKVVSIGGNYDIAKRVKLLNEWSDGEWERLELHHLMDAQVLDAAIFGLGAIKVSPRFGRPFAEGVWSGNLWVDPREELEMKGKVRTLYQHACKDRESLAEEYPEHRETIMAAMGVPDSTAALFGFIPSNSTTTADLVGVVEAWRLPPGPNRPGRHVICVDGVDLLDEEWKHDMFPFSFLKWGEDPLRFWGQGMVERGAGAQSELNELSETTRESYDKWFPAWLVPMGTTITAKMTDEIGQIVHYDPSLGPPQFYTPGAVGAELVQREIQLQDRVRSTVGVSAMDSAGEEPSNLTSGKALLVRKDLKSIRFGRQGRAYEKACVDLEKALLMVADDIADEHGEDSLDVYGGDAVLKHIKFGEARMKKDTEYRVRCEPISQMADTLDGRLEQVQIMLNARIVQDRMQMLRLLDAPDLVTENDHMKANRDIVDRAIESCLEGEMVEPHMYMDVSYAVQRANSALNLAEMQDAPAEGLDTLRAFIGLAREVERKQQQAVAQQQAAAMAPQPVPGEGGDPAAMPDDGALPPVA